MGIFCIEKYYKDMNKNSKEQTHLWIRFIVNNAVRTLCTSMASSVMVLKLHIAQWCGPSDLKSVSRWIGSTFNPNAGVYIQS